MGPLNTQQLRELQLAVNAAREISSLPSEIHGIYRELGEQVVQRQPRCDASGRCCRFEEFGHLLFVTTAELAVFANDFVQFDFKPSIQPISALKVLSNHARDGRGCKFQVGNLCGVHAIRPFGCRVFYCDSSATQWQQDAYEHFHNRLRQIHSKNSIPYFYVEWRKGLTAISQPGDVATQTPL